MCSLKDDPEGSADGAAVVGNGASFGDWDAAFFAKQEPDSLCELIVVIFTEILPE